MNADATSVKTVVSIIVSHNNRIQCFLTDMFGIGKTRFKNCAILKLTVFNGEISVELVDSGTLSPGSKKVPSAATPYYLTDEEYNAQSDFNVVDIAMKKYEDALANSRKFSGVVNNAIDRAKADEAAAIAKTNYDTLNNAYQKITSYKKFETISKDLPKVEDYNLTPDTKYVFYIVRHGEAYHNTIKFFNGTIDTSLTGNTIDKNIQNAGYQPMDGINQSYRAGLKLGILIDKIDYLFVSSLVRTHQTLKYMLDGMEFIGKLPKNLPVVVVLPCSHELVGIPAGKCDLNNAGKLIAPENVTSKNTSYKIQNLSKNWSLNKDWHYYDEFYSPPEVQDMGKREGATRNRGRCRDTDMIKESIKIMREWNSVKPKGGKSRRKNTKNKRNKRSKRSNIRVRIV